LFQFPDECNTNPIPFTILSIDINTPLIMTQDFFLYIDPTDYSRDAQGMFQACYDEVVAEAKDTGDYPMYSEDCLIKSAQWKQDDLIDYLQQVMG